MISLVWSSIIQNWLIKMKLRSFVTAVFCCLWAAEAMAVDPGLRYIQARGRLLCGTNTDAPAYAAKDENGMWKGFDVDMCQAISIAIFGAPDKYEMVDVRTDQIAKYLKSGRIDVMMGGSSLAASAEARSKFAPAAILYYDKQVFLARKAQGAKSMEDYRFANVCVVNESNDTNNVEEFSARYNLGLKIIPFNSELRAKQAFLLNRCDLMVGNRAYIHGVWNEHFAENPDVKMIPEDVAIKPVYILVDKDNPKLQATIRWVVNALQMAEMYGMNMKTASIQIGLKNTSQRNLMGEAPKLWNSFGIKPKWLKTALSKVGNFGEIYERNFGKYSELKFDRGDNKYLKDGGLLNPQPFL